MRTHSPFIVDVREALEDPGSRRSLILEATIPELSVGLTSVPDDVRFDLTVEGVEGGVLVRGRLRGEAVGECRRCLKPLRRPFDLQAAEVYRPPGDVWEEGYVIKDSKIDLEPLGRDTVAMELAGDPLCRPDCAGLCPRCGADLNEGPCGCPEEGDLRWAALRDLGRATE